MRLTNEFIRVAARPPRDPDREENYWVNDFEDDLGKHPGYEIEDEWGLQHDSVFAYITKAEGRSLPYPGFIVPPMDLNLISTLAKKHHGILWRIEDASYEGIGKRPGYMYGDQPQEYEEQLAIVGFDLDPWFYPE